MATEYKSIETTNGDEESEWFWQQVLDLARQYHYPLFSAGVQFMAVFIAKWTGKPPVLDYALKVKGLPIVAKAEIISTANRICGMGDARLVIDRYSWDHMTPNQRRAMIDDCLESIETVLDQDGNLVKDSADRPKLRIRPFDYACSGFKAVAERHKEHSIEKLQLDYAAKTLGQLAFDFMSDAPRPEIKREILTEKLAREDELIN